MSKISPQQLEINRKEDIVFLKSVALMITCALMVAGLLLAHNAFEAHSFAVAFAVAAWAPGIATFYFLINAMSGSKTL